MGCPVLGCSSTHFTKHRNLVNHWKKFHEPFVTLFRCEACKKFFGRKADAQQHLRRQHRMYISPWNKQNHLYIHPGSVMMPRLPRQPLSTVLENQPVSSAVEINEVATTPRPPVGWPPKAVNSKPVPFGKLHTASTPSEVATSTTPNPAREAAAKERKRMAEEAVNSPLYRLHCRHEDHLLPFEEQPELDYE